MTNMSPARSARRGPLRGSGRLRRRHRRPALATLLAILAVVLGGCGTVSSSPPAPTPTDFSGIATDLAAQGIGIDQLVSGDPGCPDPSLVPTAISFLAHGLDQAKPTKLYIYIFSSADVYRRRNAAVDACARSYISDPATYERVDASPFVVTGQGPWGPTFTSRLRAALMTAAGDGG